MSYMWYVIYVSWLIHICTMSHSYMCHDSLQYANSIVHMYSEYRVNMSCVWCIKYVPWRIHMYAMTHRNMQTVSYTCTPNIAWMCHICAMTRSYKYHDSLQYANSIVHMYSEYSWICHTYNGHEQIDTIYMYLRAHTHVFLEGFDSNICIPAHAYVWICHTYNSDEQIDMV